jgi:hypothetical protein
MKEAVGKRGGGPGSGPPELLRHIKKLIKHGAGESLPLINYQTVV